MLSSKMALGMAVAMGLSSAVLLNAGHAAAQDTDAVASHTEEASQLDDANMVALSSEGDAELGRAILRCLHPTGSFTYASFDDPVLRSDGIAEGDGRIKWRGGFSDNPYRTDVTVQVRRVDGELEFRVRVTRDTSIWPYNENCRMLSWTPMD